MFQEYEDQWKKEWFQFILDNPDKEWDYGRLSINPNITWDIVKSNPDKPWDYDILYQNAMSLSKENFIRKKLQEDFSKSELKRELMEVIFHPKNLSKWEEWGFDE